MVLGDGEEVVSEITRVVGDWKASGRRPDREEVLRALAGFEGVYVPAAYEVSYDGDTWSRSSPAGPRPPRWWRSAPSPTWPSGPTRASQLVPLTEVVHDRLNVEVFRGCTRGCRFCQAGMITRPVRERPAEQVRSMVADGLPRTGYDEVALTSLSTADFSGIAEVVGGDRGRRRRAAGCRCRCPSLRVDAFGVEHRVRRSRRAGGPG